MILVRKASLEGLTILKKLSQELLMIIFPAQMLASSKASLKPKFLQLEATFLHSATYVWLLR